MNDFKIGDLVQIKLSVLDNDEVGGKFRYAIGKIKAIYPQSSNFPIAIQFHDLENWRFFRADEIELASADEESGR